MGSCFLKHGEEGLLHVYLMIDEAEVSHPAPPAWISVRMEPPPYHVVHLTNVTSHRMESLRLAVTHVPG